ncbi:MAG: tape measure protein [Bifidobacterium sp.]|nr:tape measure protein [Bifidobacterium sp.]
MAKELGTGYIIIQPSTKGLGKAIEGSIESAVSSGSSKGSKTLLQKVGGSFGKVGKVGVGAVAAVGGAVAGLAAKGGFDRALNIERAQTKLKALGHDTKSIDGIMSDALASVKGTAFGLGDAASVAAQLVASGVKQGKGLENALTLVGDAAQVAGVEFTDMGTIFSKVAATGHLQGDEMNQLMEAGIPVLQDLAKHYGVTADEARKMVSDGKVSFEDFSAAMQEHFGGAAQRAGESFDGAMANIKAALSRVGEGFGTPLIKGATKLANQLIPVVDQLAGAFKPLQAQFENVFNHVVDVAGVHIEEFSKKLESGEITIQDLGRQLGLLAGGFATLAAVGGNINPLLDAVNTFADGADSAVAKAGDAFKALPGKFKTGVSEAGEHLHKLTAYFDPVNREILAKFGDSGARIAQGFAGMKDQFKNGIDKLGNTKLGSAVGKIFDGMKTGIGTGAAKVKGAITEKMAGLAFAFENNPIVTSVKGLGGKISGSLGTLGGKVKTALTPVGNVLGGIGDMVGPKLKGGLDKVGGILTSFFSPGNFMKFVGVGAIVSALVAGVGAINEATGGQIAQFATGLMSQLGGLVEQAKSFITGKLPELLQSGSQLIVSIMQGVTANLPGLLDVAGQAVYTLVSGLAAALPQLMPAGVQMITTLITSLVEQIPMLLQAGMSLLQGLAQGILAALPVLVEQIPTIIDSIITALATGLPLILAQGAQILLNLVNGIVNQMPPLIAQVPRIITTIVNGLTQNLPRIIQSGMQILVKLINGLTQALPQLISYVPRIIASIVQTLASNLPQIIQAGMQILVMLIKGLIQAIPQLAAAIPQCVSAIKDGFSSVNWGEVGMAIINGVKDGVANAAKGLWDAAANAVGGAIDWVKQKFGIHSPSRVWRDQVGVFLGEGIAAGLDASAKTVQKAGAKLVDGALPDRISLPGVDMDRWKTQLNRAARDAGFTSGMSVASTGILQGLGGSTVNYTIEINGERLNADNRLTSLLDELVAACGVSLKARA